MKEFNKTQELRKIKFKQNKNTYIKRISIILSCVILLVGIIMFTFAKFESNKSYTLIQGKLGDYSSGDLTIGAVIDGVSASFPNYGDAYLTNVICLDNNNNNVNVTIDKNNWILKDITVRNKTKCTFYFTTEVVPSTEFKVGDFVEFTPTLTSYTPTTDSSSPYYTGTSTPGTINPSELTKWVVIKDIEHDGVVEMISYNVSSNQISFSGLTGYNNYFNAFNEIARAYTNEAFIDTSKIRYFGNVSGSTSDNSYYEADVNIVKNAFQVRKESTLISSTPNNTVSSYWISSQYAYYNSTYHNTEYSFRIIDNNGLVSSDYIQGASGNPSKKSHSIRPIVTLKDDVHASSSGDGSENHPWVLVE